MSLLFADGFDHYSDLSDVDAKWTSAEGGIGTADWSYLPNGGRFGGGAVRFVEGTGFPELRKTFAAHGAVIIGFALKVTGSPGIQLWDAEYIGALGGRLYLESDFTLSIRDKDGNLVANSSDGTRNNSIHQDRWWWVEWYIDAANGETELRVNEEVYISNVSGNFDGQGSGLVSSFQSVSTGQFSGPGPILFDDVIIMDTAGPAPLNSFLGDIRIESLLPVADTADIDFAASPAGPNYENVDDDAFDRDSTYNQSNTPGERDVFEFEDMSETPKDVIAVVNSIAARKTQAGTRGLESIMRLNGVEEMGVEELLIADYIYEQWVFPDDPEGNPWTQAGVNALQAGYEVGPTQ